MTNPAPKEDTWAFQQIGDPFPDNPVKVTGQQVGYFIFIFNQILIPLHFTEHVRLAVVQERQAASRIWMERRRRCAGIFPLQFG